MGLIGWIIGVFVSMALQFTITNHWLHNWGVGLGGAFVFDLLMDFIIGGIFAAVFHFVFGDDY